jgi:hypothetical protein
MRVRDYLAGTHASESASEWVLKNLSAPGHFICTTRGRQAENQNDNISMLLV